MTSEELHALGRRAVACKGFRWLPGMKVLDSFRVVESVVPMMFPVDTPDLADAGTLGCLLALVREAWNDHGIACVTSSYINGRYHRRVVDGHHHGSTFQTMSRATYSTEAEALVAALEAAP